MIDLLLQILSRLSVVLLQNTKSSNDSFVLQSILSVHSEQVFVVTFRRIEFQRDDNVFHLLRYHGYNLLVCDLQIFFHFFAVHCNFATFIKLACDHLPSF